MKDNINLNNAKIEISATNKRQYPKSLPLGEIVLVGKSNIGKSSFINSMLNRKKLARTSSEPGKTRQINFYNIDDMFYFVDLPGYGYSKMSKKEQLQSGKYIEEYLEESKDISLIILLVDIRHNPTNDDIHMYNYILSKNIPFMVLCNKADKLAKTKVEAKKDEIKEIFGISYSPIYAYSSTKKEYVEPTWENIFNIIEDMEK